MIRRLISFCMILSCGLAMALGWMWLRNRVFGDAWMWCRGQVYYEIRAQDGRVSIARIAVPFDVGTGVSWHNSETGFVMEDGAFGGLLYGPGPLYITAGAVNFRRGTFNCDGWGVKAFGTYWQVMVHYNLLVTLFALPPILWLAICLRRSAMLIRRRRLGLCVNCGYDLRASAGKCPECGMVISAASIAVTGAEATA